MPKDDDSVVHSEDSPQRQAARSRSADATNKHKGFRAVPAKFLLTCSPQDLADMELMRLSEVQNLRSDLMEILDRMVEIATQASMIRWFGDNDRESIKAELLRDGALDQRSIMDWAKEDIRSQGKEGEEKVVPLPSLNPGQAHRTAAQTYQNRNIAKGKCMSCPEPLDPNSVRYCTKHLAMGRARASQKKALSDPGSREFLYAGEITPTHGRSPDNLARLAMLREQKTREVLADLGISPDSAAVSLKAAMEALVKCMPTSRAEAKTQDELFSLATVPSKNTGIKAINELLAAGSIERIGTGGKGHEYRYFVRKRKSHWVRQNKAILTVLKGEAE